MSPTPQPPSHRRAPEANGPQADVTQPPIAITTAASWSSTGLRDALQVIADGACELAEFDVAAVSVLHPNDEFEFIAVSGGDARLASLIGRTNSRAAIDQEFANADRYGEFFFLPGDRQTYILENTWTPELDVPDHDEAWRPDDMMQAQLRDEAGEVTGMLSVDLPRNGLRPNEETMRILNAYARQAGRVLSNAMDHHFLVERLRLSQAARAIVRNANPRDGIDFLIEQCAPTIQSGFKVDRLWVHLYGDRGEEAPQLTDGHGFAVQLADEALTFLMHRAERAWIEGQPWMLVSSTTAPLDQARADVLDRLGITALMLVPLGAAEVCFGSLLMARTWNDVGWAEAETEIAMEIGRDMGQAIANARFYERDQQLVSRLEKLDEHKRELIATMAHEFKNPIAAISGHVEMLEGFAETHALRSLAAINRSANRMSGLVEDLLQFSRVTTPGYPLDLEQVELGSVVRDTIELINVQASARDQTLEADLCSQAAVATADRQQLAVLCINLLSNAVKYSADGSTIRTRVVVDGDDAELTVSDQGLGISEEDQERLFEEFFRTSNPTAHKQPGTGLGLAIVNGIVRRHGGSIEVRSQLGVGTDFVVRIPLRGPAPDSAD